MFEGGGVENAEHRTAGRQPARAPAGADNDRRIVSGVDEGELAGNRIVDGIEERDEPPQPVVADERGVDICGHVRRCRVARRIGAHRRLQVRHQERRRETLAADVRD
ncbi:hypothetical protein D3C83_22490 [compost metagenome]